MGSVEQSFNPVSVALGSECTFIARTVDVFAKHQNEVLKAAAGHTGTSFVEIYQNCIIYNGLAWEHMTDVAVREENVLYLEHGQPMIFGKDRDKGIRLNGLRPEVVQLGNDIGEADLMVHDAYTDDPTLAWLLSRMGPPEFPTPIGVFRAVAKPSYTDLMLAQNAQAREKRGPGDLAKLYRNADTWEVAAKTAAAASSNGGSNGR
jgi:2-oxoglutarate ferredoxin oxidoreductase subunit beta